MLPEIKYKKGEDKLMSVWWLFVILLLVVAVAFATSLYFGAEVDAREVECLTLQEKIFGCITERGFLIPEFFEEDFDVYSKCGLNKGVFEEGLFYSNISFTGSKISNEIILGDKTEFAVSCSLLFDGSKINYLFCSEKRERIFYNLGEIKEGNVNVLVASKNKGGLENNE